MAGSDTLRLAAKQIECGAQLNTMPAELMIWIAPSEKDAAAARALEAMIASNVTEILEA